MATKRAPKKTATVAPEELPTKQEFCFTIMPFGGWFDAYYDGIYVPAIKAAGLSPRRADDLYRPSTIVHDIWSYTQSSKLVLADLSGKNPNVFYELGLAHALAKPAILITESIEDVPFDLRALRVLEYNKNEPRWGEVLQEKITNSIKEVLQSPLQSVLPAFLSVRPETKSKPVSEQERNLLELRRELDLLRSEVARVRTFSRRPGLDAQEARERIQSYLSQGIPAEAIVERLVDRGPPLSWIRRTIAEFQNQLELMEQSGDSSSPPGA